MFSFSEENKSRFIMIYDEYILALDDITYIRKSNDKSKVIIFFKSGGSLEIKNEETKGDLLKGIFEIMQNE